MSLCTVSGKLINADGAVPTEATVSLSLQYPPTDVPRQAGADAIMPFSSPTATVSASDGSFSLDVIGNDQVTPTGTYYKATFAVGSNEITANYNIVGAAVDLNSAVPIGALPPAVTYPPYVTVSVGPTSAPGNLAVNHYLGHAPTTAIVMMTSSGAIWFQSPVLFDGNSLYLVASEAGIEAKVVVW